MSLPKPTFEENKRCTVEPSKTLYGKAYVGKAVSGEFVRDCQIQGGCSSIDLHSYCRDVYGEDYVSYINFAYDPENRASGRAVCCKKLPAGMTRKEYIRLLEDSNRRMGIVLNNEATRLTNQLSLIQEAFQQCVSGACNNISIGAAQQLARGWKMYELIVDNHLEHLRLCRNVTYDPTAGCMRFTQLHSYLKRNTARIDRVHELMKTIINKIANKPLLQNEEHVQQQHSTTTTFAILETIRKRAIRLAALIWRYKYKLAFGALVVSGSMALFGPSLATFVQTVGVKGIESALQGALQQLSSQLCWMLQKRPVIVSFIISSLVYKILTNPMFKKLLLSAFKGTALIASGGIFYFWLKASNVEMDEFFNTFINNKTLSVAVYGGIPYFFVTYGGFIISGMMAAVCGLSNVVTSGANVIQRAVDVPISLSMELLNWFGWATGESGEGGETINLGVQATSELLEKMFQATTHGTVSAAKAADYVVSLIDPDNSIVRVLMPLLSGLIYVHFLDNEPTTTTVFRQSIEFNEAMNDSLSCIRDSDCSVDVDLKLKDNMQVQALVNDLETLAETIAPLYVKAEIPRLIPPPPTLGLDYDNNGSSDDENELLTPPTTTLMLPPPSVSRRLVE